uniref:Neprosin PEP catalytic domain-containing protein n=1 Tax=Arundo donax TaxID=35708 RepID=A0A0A9D9I7_ARUDO
MIQLWRVTILGLSSNNYQDCTVTITVFIKHDMFELFSFMSCASSTVLGAKHAIMVDSNCAVSFFVAYGYVLSAKLQLSPDLYGDNTRPFTYRTSDAYQATGCYNLLCSWFIQINSQIAMAPAYSPSPTMVATNMTSIFWSRR